MLITPEQIVFGSSLPKGKLDEIAIAAGYDSKIKEAKFMGINQDLHFVYECKGGHWRDANAPYTMFVFMTPSGNGYKWDCEF